MATSPSGTTEAERAAPARSHSCFDGQIDNFRVYNRALSAGDILRVYNGL